MKVISLLEQSSNCNLAQVVKYIYAGKIPSIKQSIGIELVKERHDDANKLKTQLNHHTRSIKS